MNFLRRDESWFADISELELEDKAKELFGVFAPTVSKKVTILGNEYVLIEGFTFNKEGIDNFRMRLNHVGPAVVKETGEVYLDSKSIENNLKACRDYIRFMDEKNLGRVVNGCTYPQQAANVYKYCVDKINILKGRGSEPGGNN